MLFGLDHSVGPLVSMTTEKTPDLIPRGIATRETQWENDADKIL
jgi:hypothetical protein